MNHLLATTEMLPYTKWTRNEVINQSWWSYFSVRQLSVKRRSLESAFRIPFVSINADIYTTMRWEKGRSWVSSFAKLVSFEGLTGLTFMGCFLALVNFWNLNSLFDGRSLSKTDLAAIIYRHLSTGKSDKCDRHDWRFSLRFCLRIEWHSELNHLTGALGDSYWNVLRN